MATALSQETANTIIETLRPIRDLTKNWDIDIAGCLEVYLQDLELSAETRAQLSTTKFAEAALLLHNSSGVYSRKVDFLHSYAYRVQRELAEHHSTVATRKNKRNIGIDKDVERFLNYDPNQDFLLLDDVVPIDTGDKVNLKSSTTATNSSTRGKALEDSFNGKSRSTRRRSASASTVNDVHIQRIAGILNTQGLRLSLGKCDVDDNGLCWLPGSSSQKKNLITTENDIKQTFDQVEDDGDMVMMNDGIDEYGDNDDDDDGAGFDMAIEAPPARKVSFAEQVVMDKPHLAVTEKEDPWQLLDPHVPDQKLPRPLRLGKTIVLPECMKRLPSEHCKKKEPIPEYLNRPMLEPVKTEPTSWTVGKRAREELPLRGFAYGNEFAYIAKEIAKRKMRERKNAADNARDKDGEQKTEHNEWFGANYFGDGDDDDDAGGFPEMNDDEPIGTNTGIDSVDDLYGNPIHEGDEDGKPTDKPPSFEELCREHIRRFAKGAERYAVQTKLSERVDQWQSKLRPILDAEEQRPPFDIHEYGEAVIQDMQDSVARSSEPTKTVSFANVTNNCSRYEVCRRFLASLSLVNSGNIRLVDGPDVQFELLSTEIERPMETFLAPSASGDKD